MRPGDRSSTILLTVITLGLALAAGLVIPLAGGSTPGGRPQPWTPPPSPTPTNVPPIATARATVGAKSAAPTTTRTLSAATRSTKAPQSEAPTATVAPTSAAVISPTATLTSRAAASAPRAQVRDGPLVLRAGPNLGQPAISSAQVGQVFTVTGRTADNAWLQVCCVNNAPAWLASQFAVITGTLTTLPVKP